MKILLIMLVVVVGMKLFAYDNEIMLKPWDTDPIMLKPWDTDPIMLKPWDTDTDSIMEEVENRQIQRDYEKRISDLEYELKKLKEKERMENIRPDFVIKPYIIPAHR